MNDHDRSPLHARIEVSEPWDFPVLGEMSASVLEQGDVWVSVRLARPVEYQGRRYDRATLTPRHTDGVLRPDGSSVPVNIALGNDACDGSAAAGHAAPFVIGTAKLFP
jgi:hypothetical protein